MTTEPNDVRPPMRNETTSEHFARDMEEGRFPEQSPVQQVPMRNAVVIVEQLREWGETPIALNRTYVQHLINKAATALEAKDAEIASLRRVLAAATAEMQKGYNDCALATSRALTAEAALVEARGVLKPFAEIGAWLTPENGWSDDDVLNLIYEDDRRFADLEVSTFRLALATLEPKP